MQAQVDARMAGITARQQANEMATRQLQEHYARQMERMLSYFQSAQTMPPPPPDLFAPPPPLPTDPVPAGTPVSILTLPLACASMLHILMISLGV